VTQPLDTSTVKLTANLSEDKVAVQQRSIERLKADPGEFVNRYRMEFGDHFNPDNAAELFPDYCSSPENRAKYRLAVAGAAGWVSDEAFRERLAEPDEMPVLFTAGGTGSGKSTIAGPAADAGLIVFDSTFSNTDLSKQRLQEALDSGRHVEVCYVYRDPGEAWSAGKTRTEEEGAGRTLTTQVHASTHAGAAQTVEQLTRDFSNNPQVEFTFFENSTAHGLQVGGLELTRKGERTSVAEDALKKIMPSTPTAMPARLPREHLAILSREGLTDYVYRIAVAAVDQCRENKDQFLRQYPRLDFRKRK
jgi:hypothetical protein